MSDEPNRTYEGLMERLWKAADRGNVPAMRLLLEELKAERRAAAADSGSVIDQLAARRNTQPEAR